MDPAKYMVGVPYLEVQDVNEDGSLKPHVGGGLPVIVLLQGVFCPHCTTAKGPFKQFAVQSTNVRAVTAQTDGSPPEKSAARLLSKYNSGGGVPAYLAFDRDGKFVRAIVGAKPVEALQAFAQGL